jgi:hypothetical protein
MGKYLERRLLECKIIVLNLTDGHVSAVFDNMPEACDWCDRLRAQNLYKRFEVYEKVEHDPVITLTTTPL